MTLSAKWVSSGVLLLNATKEVWVFIKLYDELQVHSWDMTMYNKFRWLYNYNRTNLLWCLIYTTIKIFIKAVFLHLKVNIINIIREVNIV